MMFLKGISSLVLVRNINGHRAVGILCNGAGRHDIPCAISLHFKQLIDGLYISCFSRVRDIVRNPQCCQFKLKEMADRFI